MLEALRQSSESRQWVKVKNISFSPKKNGWRSLELWVTVQILNVLLCKVISKGTGEGIGDGQTPSPWQVQIIYECIPESMHTWKYIYLDKMYTWSNVWSPSVKGLKFQKSLCPTEISLNGTFILTKHYVTCPEESVFFCLFIILSSRLLTKHYVTGLEERVWRGEALVERCVVKRIPCKDTFIDPSLSPNAIRKQLAADICISKLL